MHVQLDGITHAMDGVRRMVPARYGWGCNVPLAGHRQPAGAEHPAELLWRHSICGCIFKPATPNIDRLVESLVGSWLATADSITLRSPVGAVTSWVLPSMRHPLSYSFPPTQHHLLRACADLLRA